MTVDLTVGLIVDEAELELLIFLVDSAMRKRRGGLPHPDPHYRKAAEGLFAKLMKANDGMLTAIMRAGERAGE